jgi:hypothetical protein
MIPVMIRVWMPHGQAAAAELCEDTYGANFYPDLYDNFSGTGAINGELVEFSNDRLWTYSSAAATKSGGSVSPATFSTVFSSSVVTGNRMLLKVNMAASETLTLTVHGSGYVVSVALTLGAGESCVFTYKNDDEAAITDTFSIGNTPGSITVGFDLGSTFNGTTEVEEMFAYLAPNLVSSPVATVVVPSPVSYTQVAEVVFSSTGTDTSVDYFRVCADSGG